MNPHKISAQSDNFYFWHPMLLIELISISNMWVSLIVTCFCSRLYSNCFGFLQEFHCHLLLWQNSNWNKKKDRGIKGHFYWYPFFYKFTFVIHGIEKNCLIHGWLGVQITKALTKKRGQTFVFCCKQISD